MKSISKGKLYTSYALQGLVAIMFLMGAANNILQTEMAVNGATDMGYPANSVICLGITLLISTILYVIPTTNIFGAILLTAWLGGAVATHIIHQDPFTNILLPVAFGVILWVAIWLRNDNLKKVFPVNT